jgi:hypothetical protein
LLLAGVPQLTAGSVPAGLPLGLAASLAWVFTERTWRDRLRGTAMRVLDSYCELVAKRDDLVRRLAMTEVE